MGFYSFAAAPCFIKGDPAVPTLQTAWIKWAPYLCPVSPEDVGQWQFLGF